MNPNSQKRIVADLELKYLSMRDLYSERARIREASKYCSFTLRLKALNNIISAIEEPIWVEIVEENELCGVC